MQDLEKESNLVALPEWNIPDIAATYRGVGFIFREVFAGKWGTAPWNDEQLDFLAWQIQFGFSPPIELEGTVFSLFYVSPKNNYQEKEKNGQKYLERLGPNIIFDFHHEPGLSHQAFQEINVRAKLAFEEASDTHKLEVDFSKRVLRYSSAEYAWALNLEEGIPLSTLIR